MGWFLDERTTRKLDEDQRRTVKLLFHGQPEEMLMINESGAYALLSITTRRGIDYYAIGSLMKWFRRCATSADHER